MEEDKMNESQPTDGLNLWNKDVTEAAYGAHYKEHLFEQYKLYVEMADQVSNRRNLANTFFLTLHTLLLGVLGFAFEKGPALVDRWVIAFPLAAVLLLCLAWWMIVRSYRQLNAGKFRVIGEFEERLPASPYWSAEWKVLGEGKDIRKYLPLTHVENWIPILFAFLYIIVALIVYFSPKV
jgi:hypothetical protein